jgi:hypothetical protein
MQSAFGAADAVIVVELGQNQMYNAFREVGCVMRTVGAAAVPRRRRDAGTGDPAINKAEAYNWFSAWSPVRQTEGDLRERPG